MTNYRVNPALPPASIAKIEYFKDRDPSFYDIVGIGLPGVPKGGVYAHLLRFISRLTQEGNIYTAGLDWGFKHDPLTTILISSQNSYQSVDVIGELQIVNQSRYSNQMLANIVVRWLISQATLYPKLRGGLLVYCDRTNLAFIEMLNTAATREYATFLTFVPNTQLEIEWRIGFKQWLISANKLNIALDCKVLYQELLLATWDMQASKPKLLKGCADHMMDAFDYALEPWYSVLLRQANPYYFPRGTPSRILLGNTN